MTPEDFGRGLHSVALGQEWSVTGATIDDRKVIVATNRFREPAGAYGLVWTKCVIVCIGVSSPTRGELDHFAGEAGRFGLRRTRWQIPFRGIQGCTLTLALAAVPSLEPEVAEWATALPAIRFAAMTAPVAVDLRDGSIHLSRAEPRLGKVLHHRRLLIADTVIAAASDAVSKASEQ